MSDSKFITVVYPQNLARQDITKAEYNLIGHKDVHKIVAIKFIRETYSLGLFEAKQIVDTVRDRVQAENLHQGNRY